MGAFKEAHGGELKQLYLSEAAAGEMKETAVDFRSWNLTERQACDIELILNGAFSPLDGFLTRDEYDAVLQDMRLPSGILWPIPITLDVSEKFASKVEQGEFIALRDREGALIATLQVSDIWVPDKVAEARQAFGTNDPAHPGVRYLMEQRAFPGSRIQKMLFHQRMCRSLYFRSPE